MNENELIGSVQKKIEREKALIAGATQMRAAATNAAVQSQLDNQIRDGRRNIQYFESKLRELQSRKLGQGIQNMPMGSGSAGPLPPAHGVSGIHQGRQRNGDLRQGHGPRGGYGGTGTEYGDAGPGGYSGQLTSTDGMVPPRPPFGPLGPADRIPRARPNYCKLGRCDARSPHRMVLGWLTRSLN